MGSSTKATVLISLTTILLLIAIAQLITSRLALNFAPGTYIQPAYEAVYDYRDPDWREVGPLGWVYAIPPGIQRGSLWAVFVISIVSVAAGLFLLLAAYSPVHGKQTRPNLTKIPLFFSVVPALAAPIALVYAMVQHYTSSTFDLEDFLASRPIENVGYRTGPVFGEEGTWSLEAWTCQTKIIWTTRMFLGGYARTCDLAAASRWLTIPLLICSWALLVVVFLGYNRRRRELSGGVKASKPATELSPVSSHAAPKE